MKRNAVRALTLLGAAGIAAACGEVPTLAGNIAYISPLLLPSPAIAAGDVLRDSLGNVAVLSVVAYDQHNSVITGLTPSFLVSSFPVVVSIDANGRVTAQDTVASVHARDSAATGFHGWIRHDRLAACGPELERASGERDRFARR